MNKIRDMINEVLDQQDKKGMDTYGQTLADCDDNAYDWQNMALQELADAVQYLSKENLKLDREKQELIKIIESLVPHLENQIRMGTLDKLKKFKTN